LERFKLRLGLVMLAPALACADARAQHIIRFHQTDIPIPLADGGVATLWVGETDAVQVTTHIPGPFELSLSMAATGTAQVTGPVPARTSIDGSLAFTSADHQVWCIGGGGCIPPYNGNGYYGVRFALADGTHYGWIGTYFANLGFGRVELRINGGAYDNRPDHAIMAGVFEAMLGECESADFDCDGDTGTDADIQAFFACLAGSCPPPPCNNTADFFMDGDVGTDADIEAFFRVLAGNPCTPP
jgi:hypothetical protein